MRSLQSEAKSSSKISLVRLFFLFKLKHSIQVAQMNTKVFATLQIWYFHDFSKTCKKGEPTGIKIYIHFLLLTRKPFASQLGLRGLNSKG